MADLRTKFIMACHEATEPQQIAVPLLEYIRTLGTADIVFRYVAVTTAYKEIDLMALGQTIPINHFCPRLAAKLAEPSPVIRQFILTKENPVYAAMMSKHRPYVTWNYDYIQDDAFRAEMTDTDVGWGVTLPFSTNQLRVGGLHLAVSRAADIPEGGFLSMLRVQLPNIHVIKALIFTHLLTTSHFKPTHGLTKRELQVIDYLSQGLTRGEIAEKFGISEYTVRDVIRNISKKLNAERTVDIVVKALRLGIIS